MMILFSCDWIQKKFYVTLLYNLRMWRFLNFLLKCGKCNTHTEICMYIYIYIYIHLHSYIHTCAYSFIHIYIYIWLVVWNIFSIIYGMSSFPLTFIFFKMVKTTNQIYTDHTHINQLFNPLHITAKATALMASRMVLQRYAKFARTAPCIRPMRRPVQHGVWNQWRWIF